MRKIRKNLCFSAIVLVVSSIMFAGYSDTHYTRKNCTIVGIKENEITVQDRGGNLWCFEQNNGENFTKGEKVTLKMHTNGTTQDTNDDKILKIIK